MELPALTGRADRLEWRFSAEAMASPLRLFVSGPPGVAEAAERAWAAVRSSFEAAEQALSNFRPDSDLAELNRRVGAETVIASPLLVRALVAADRAHRLTAGRFDPRILADLERLGLPSLPVSAGATGPGIPRPGPVGRLVHRAGRSNLVRIDARVDLGGIGKGLALRWATRAAGAILGIAATGGSTGFLLEAGGDLVTGGPGPAGDWLVDVEDPEQRRDSLAVVRLPPGSAAATSSIRLRRWSAPDGRIVHHLVDPRTGEPGGDGLASVTVSGTDPAWAEVWTKALFLEGAAGIAVAARRRGLAAWWVTTDGRLEMTPAARPMTVWLANPRG